MQAPELCSLAEQEIENQAIGAPEVLQVGPQAHPPPRNQVISGFSTESRIGQ